MHADAAGRHVADRDHLRQPPIPRRKPAQGLGAEVLRLRLLPPGVQLERLQVVCDLVAFLLAEAEDHRRRVAFRVQSLAELDPVGLATAGSPRLRARPVRHMSARARPALGLGRTPAATCSAPLDAALPLLLRSRLQSLQPLLLLLPELGSGICRARREEAPLRVEDEKVLPLQRQVVHQRHRPVLRGDHVDRSPLRPADPFAELDRVRRRRREEDHAHVGREHDDHFFPDDASLAVVDVVHLVEDDPLQVAHKICPAIQHASQDLRRHHHARRVRVDTDVARHDAHVVAVPRPEIAVLLVAQRLDRRSVHAPGTVAHRKGDGILRYHRLASAGVRCDEDVLLLLEAADRLLLEAIQFEGILDGWVRDHAAEVGDSEQLRDGPRRPLSTIAGSTQRFRGQCRQDNGFARASLLPLRQTAINKRIRSFISRYIFSDIFGNLFIVPIGALRRDVLVILQAKAGKLLLDKINRVLFGRSCCGLSSFFLAVLRFHRPFALRGIVLDLRGNRFCEGQGVCKDAGVFLGIESEAQLKPDALPPSFSVGFLADRRGRLERRRLSLLAAILCV
mmetsp:Transcript_16843/g.64133  ORF Transcript_16843/g.64133 Transcript_16843/m.64133 type:complete len:565 (-) Transcript_16843:922-2616(-)